MSQNIYMVVGNEYEMLSKHSQVLTAEKFLSLKHAQTQLSIESIVLGLGINREQQREIIRVADERGIRFALDIPDAASAHLTHKADSDNVLIGAPVPLEPKIYAFDLILDDTSDRLSDHVTGQHVGAMLLMEAARQAVIATLELEFPATAEVGWGYILERFNTEYKNYAFPVPTKLHLSLSVLSEKEGRQIRVELPIEVFQNGTQVANMVMGVTLCDKKLLETMEQRRARAVIDGVLLSATALAEEKERIFA